MRLIYISHLIVKRVVYGSLELSKKGRHEKSLYDVLIHACNQINKLQVCTLQLACSFLIWNALILNVFESFHADFEPNALSD